MRPHPLGLKVKPHLPGEEHERKIPRDDGTHHSNWSPPLHLFLHQLSPALEKEGEVEAKKDQHTYTHSQTILDIKNAQDSVSVAPLKSEQEREIKSSKELFVRPSLKNTAVPA